MEINRVLDVCEVFNELGVERRELRAFMFSSSKGLYA